jgi:type IV secretory pathway TrbD component
MHTGATRRLLVSLHRAVVSVLDRAPSLLVLLAGFLTGAVLGIVARIWMRFITTDPEFSWAGTLVIVFGFGVMFLGQAGVYLGRRSGLRPSGFVALRVLAIVTLVPLAGAAGAFAFPIIVFAPLGIIRIGWNRWLRLLLGVLALLSGVFVLFVLFSDLSAIRTSIGLVWFALIYGVLVWAVAFSFASRDDPRFTHVVRDPRRHEGALRPVRT